MAATSDGNIDCSSATASSTAVRVGDVVVAVETGIVEGPGGSAKLDPKVVAVLAHLAAAGGRLVSRNEIMEHVWPGVVVSNFALSRCIYQIRKTLGAVSDLDTSPIETLPKRGFRLDWNVSRIRQATGSGPAVSRPGLTVPAERSRRWIAIVMVVIVAAFAIENWFDLSSIRHVASSGDRAMRVSVLPLENLSGEEGQEMFARGLTREIMHEIATIPGVVAIGRDSVFEVVTAGVQALATAERLNADYVLSGNVRAVGNARRVLVDLRSVPHGELLWSRSYLIEPNAPFVMLPQLARSVAGALDFSTGGGGQAATESLEAFEAYLAASETDNLELRRSFLERAVEIDPGFAAAWDRLAETEVYPVWNGQVPAQEAWRRAKPSLDRALALDPTLPSAYVTRGRLQRMIGHTDAAIASFERALELDPGNGWASANLGLSLRFEGRYEQALAIHEAAVAMDPLSSQAQARLGTSYWFTGDLDAATRHYQTAIDLNPGNEEIYDSWAGMLANGLGRFDQALAMIEKKMTLPGEPTVRTLATAGRLSSALGLDEAALDYWQRGRAINPDYLPAYHYLVQHHLERGDDGRARQNALAALRLDPGDATAQLGLAMLDFQLDNTRGFVERIRDAYPRQFEFPQSVDTADPDRALLIALAYGAQQMKAEQRVLLRTIEGSIDVPRAWQHLTLAAAYAMDNQPDVALRYLESSPPGRVRGWAALLMRDPRFASMHDLPEFRDLVAEHLEALRHQGVSFSRERAAH